MTKAEWLEIVPEIAPYPKILRALPGEFLEQLARCDHDARVILLRERHQTNHGYNLPKGWKRGGVEAPKEQIQSDAGEYIHGRTMADWMSIFAQADFGRIGMRRLRKAAIRLPARMDRGRRRVA